MNTHELPMILFTVLAQMSVGAFIVLGVINMFAPAKYGRETVERATDPAIYAIGPTLVLGLIASMFHMNDVFNVLNVFRHFGTSWLSNEIVFGMAFAGLGFLFALMQWFKIGSHTLRQVIAGLAALAGIALIYSMSMIYMTVKAVPAWNSWVVMFHFFATAILLGSLAVGTAVIIHLNRRTAATETAPAGQDNTGGGGIATKVRTQAKTMATTPIEAKEYALASQIVRTIAIVSVVVGSMILLSYILYIIDLAGGNPTAQEAVGAFATQTFIARLLLLIVASILMALFAHKMAGHTTTTNLDTQSLAGLMFIALALATIGELIGRAFHYDLLVKIGI